MSKSKEYSNGEITVVWKPELCIHSANCVNGLPTVFDSKGRPWINIEGADSAAITAQIGKCPSGALSYYKNGADGEKREVTAERIIEVNPNGPLMVYGNLIVKHNGIEETRENRVTAFCRCGASDKKPYCDGTHKKIGFEG